ncbi:MAG: DUF2075 domain-containing protein [Actinobacteria bacterium]|nr:DUF2075 domain-containing protein [Actinomycetota bacterium]
MTDSTIEPIPFDADAVKVWAEANPRHTNWPVVYTIYNDHSIYVGETTSAANRLRQHLANPQKSHLVHARVVLDETFNSSVCLDLESQLIAYFAADEKFEVLNSNAGMSNSDYYDRDKYRQSFDDIFKRLLDEGLLTRSIPDIVNSNLFKYSPFKSLNTDQATAVEGILEMLFDSWNQDSPAPIVIQGDPGTGKTIVAIYLVKLLRDIAASDPEEPIDTNSMFADFFQPGYRETLGDVKIGLVIPQQSLRKTVQKVFKKTPGLDPKMVIDPFSLTKPNEYDLLIVDEAHRLSLRANQPSAALNNKFRAINEAFFGADEPGYTQLDWVRAASRHQILLLDAAQSVKPADLSESTIKSVVSAADAQHTLYRLHSQMRVSGGNDYIEFVGKLLNLEPTGSPDFGDYDFRIFDDFAEMRAAILEKEQEFGLSRLVAGYAWEWKSRNDPHAVDISIDGNDLQWNQTVVDWVNSSTSINEVGSIHTIQGYDLNYAGVIIGPDLTLDPTTNELAFDRSSYFDKKGKENNPRLGLDYSDGELLEYVKNIYRVLLTRGILGTFVYADSSEIRAALSELTQS